MNISKNEHLQIFLMNGWEKHKIFFKIYDLFQKNKELIDKIFDEFHDQGRRSWIKHFIFFDFLMFVIWRFVKKDDQIYRKNRTMIDIRGFNMITLPDSYSLSLQEKIISFVRNCCYITTMNAANFFINDSL